MPVSERERERKLNALRGDTDRPRSKTGLVIRAVQDVDYSRTWAIYGRSGSGKTTFLSTFPKPILLLDFKERGTDSIKDVKGIDIAYIDTWEKFEEVYYDYLLPKTCKYKTVGLDTVSQWQELTLTYIANGKKSGVQANARIEDWGAVTLRQRGEAAGMMKDWISNLRDLPMEVCFIAQERVNKEEGEDSELLLPEVGPRLMPSVASVLNASVTIIGNTFVKRRWEETTDHGKRIRKEKPPIHCMRLAPHPVYVTKLRKAKSIKVPEFVTDPNWEEVVAILKGE